jgi:NDP-sugar pyrophosphorylase family protein
LSFHRSQQATATIAAHRRIVKIDLGVLQHDPDHLELTGYIEKPSYEYMVSMGIYIFEPAVLSLISKNQYLDFPDLVLKLIAKGEKVVHLPYDGYWKDLGRPDDYEQATQDFSSMRSQFLRD